MNFFIKHVSLLAFRDFEQMSNQIISGLNVVLFEPPNDVRTAGHVADSDHLFQSKVTSGHARINPVSKPVVAFSHGLVTAEACTPVPVSKASSPNTG